MLHRNLSKAKLFLAAIILSQFPLSISMAVTSEKEHHHKENVSVPYGNDTTVKGLVYIEYFYEETEYGDDPDHDRIVGSCLLKLDHHEAVKHDLGMRILHLLFTNQNKNSCAALVGHRVSIEGSLEERHTGHHHGDALLDVKKVKILR